MLDRVLLFLKVDDPKQTKVNRLFFVLLVTWMGIGFIINTIQQFIYYFVTLQGE